MAIAILKNINIFPLLFPLALLLLYCDDPERSIDNRYERQLTDNAPIRASELGDYYGRYNRSDYSGPSCNDLDTDDDSERYDQCMEICEKIYGRDSKECQKLPVQLISDLDNLFTNMQYIRSDNDSLRRVSEFRFGVMIDISLEPALILISGWSQRETAEFLLWTAKTPSVALALVEHDKQHEILQDAFEKLGEDVTGGGSRVEYGIGKNLEGFGRTFWAVAETAKNAQAFVAMHQLLENICSGKDCKLRVYCTRDEFESNTRGQQYCHYSSDRNFRLNHCYIHGPDVWSYWKQLNDEREFGDADFPRDTILNKEVCDTICKSENCQRG